jgi:hypothetical protein
MDIILDSLPYIAVFYAAFHIGKHWALFQFSQNIANRPDDMIKVLQKIKEINLEELEGMPEDSIPMEIEQVGDVCYAYNKLTGEFLAQARDAYQAAKLAGERFPGKKFWHPSIKQNAQTV